MKLNYFFSAVLCLVAVSVAVPVPVPGGQKPAGELNSSRSSARSSSSLGSQPHTPTASGDRVPSPGRSGVHYDSGRNVVTMYYGDDMAKHGSHVQQNQAQHPGNARPMDLATPEEHRRNRQQALAGIPHLKDPKTGETLVRDEKPLAMFKHDGSTTTVQHLPSSESRKFGFKRNTHN